MPLTVSDVEDIGNGQFRCAVTITDEEGAVTRREDQYVVQAYAREGLGPQVWRLIRAGEFEGDIKPFVPQR